MDDKDNKALVERFLEVFSSGEVDAIMDMMTDDATWWVAGSWELSGTKDKQAFRELLSGISDLVDGPMKLTPKSIIAEGDKLAVEAESLAHFKNGRVYHGQYHFVFEIADGKIRRVREYLDTMYTRDIFFG